MKRLDAGALVTRRFWLETKGQDLVEYALLAGLVAVSGGASSQQVGPLTGRIFRRMKRRLLNAANGWPTKQADD